jgi:hypothetical protein
MQGARDMARCAFWRRVETDAPQVAESLAQEALDIWRAARARPGFSGWTCEREAVQLLSTVPLADLRAGRPVDGDTLSVALARWAARARLARPWCVEAAATTLHDWALYSEHQHDQRFLAACPEFAPPWRLGRTWAVKLRYRDSVASVGEVPSPLFDGSFSIDEWNPSAQSWARFEQEVIRGFRRYLRESYRPAVETAALTRAPRRFADEHAGWLVAYHFNGATFAAIAEAASVDKHFVRKAIGNFASLIDLEVDRPRRFIAAVAARPRGPATSR